MNRPVERVLAHTRAVVASSRVRKMRRVFAFAFTPLVSPDRIQMWNAGDNPTDYGVHRWTDRSIECVYGAYLDRGNMLEIDIEHGMASDGPNPTPPGALPPCAGYCKLEIVNGEPWLSFEWSALGSAQIESGERRYLSPEYGVDPDTKEIISLTRVSLVAAPGTHHAVILAGKKGTMNPQDIIDAIRNALAGEGDPETKIATANAVLDGLSVAAGDGSTTDDTDAPDAPTDEAIGATGDAGATGGNPIAAGASETPFAASATDEASATITAAADPVKASRATAAQIQLAVDNGVRDVLLTLHGDKLEPVVATACKFLPRAQVEKIVASAIKKATPAVRNGRPTAGGKAAPGTPLEQIRAAAPDSQLAGMARGMGIRAEKMAPAVDERGRFTIPQRTPEEIRAAKKSAAVKGN